MLEQHNETINVTTNKVYKKSVVQSGH